MRALDFLTAGEDQRQSARAFLDEPVRQSATGFLDEPDDQSSATLRADVAAYQEQPLWKRAMNTFERGFYNAVGTVAGFNALDGKKTIDALDAFDAAEAAGDEEGMKSASREGALGQDWWQLRGNKAYRNDLRARSEQRLTQGIASYTQRQAQAQAVPRNPALEEFTRGSWWEGLKADPIGVIGGLTGESIPMMAPALAAGGLGGGAVVGGSAAALNSYVAEFVPEVMDSFREAGVDISNPQAVVDAINDPEKLSAAREFANKKAIPVAVFDGLSMGIAGKFMGPARARGTVRGEVGNVAGQVTVGGALGGTGEAAGQVSQKGKIDDVNAIAGEVLGEMGGAPLEVAAMRISPEVRATLTQDDIDSPIDNEIILEGRQILKDAEEGKPLDLPAAAGNADVLLGAEAQAQVQPLPEPVQDSRARLEETPIPPIETEQAQPFPPMADALQPPAAASPAPAAPAPPSPTPADEPPVPPGMVRLYHGSDGDAPRSGWVSPQRDYAANYYDKARVFYVDVPQDAPYLKRVMAEMAPGELEGISNPPTNQNLPEEIAEQLRPLSGAPSGSQQVASPTVVVPSPAVVQPEQSNDLGEVRTNEVQYQASLKQNSEAEAKGGANAMAFLDSNDQISAEQDQSSRSEEDAQFALSRKSAVAVIARYVGQPFQQARLKVQEWARNSLRGQHVNDATGTPIGIDGTGIRKATSGVRNHRDLDVVSELPNLIKSAVKIGTEAPRAPQQGVRAYHRFANTITYEGKPYRVVLVVREQTNGQWFYDQHSSELTEPKNEEPRRQDRGAAAEAVEPPAKSTGVQDGPAESGKGDVTQANVNREDPKDKGSDLFRSKMGDAATTETLNDLTERLRKVDPRGRIALRLREKIEAVVKGNVVKGEGQHLRGLIEIALGAADKPYILNHEIIHALRDVGVFRPEEWTTLAKSAAANKKRMDDVRERYEGLGLSEEKLVEEAVADMFADFQKGNLDPKGFERSAFNRIMEVLRALGDWLRGKGYTTPEAILGRVAEGEVGSRDTRDDKERDEPSFSVPRVKERPRSADGKFQTKKELDARRPKGTLAQERAISKAIAAPKKGGLWTRVEETYAGLRERLTDEFAWHVADEFHGLRRLGKELHPEARDRELGSYVAARFARHSAGQIEALLRHGAPKWNADDSVVEIDDAIPGFYDIVAPLYERGLDRLFEGYAYARRVKSQKLIEDGREKNLTTEDVNDLIALDKEFPAFREIFDQIQQFKTAVLNTAEGMGLINKEQRATWEQADHVPFYRAVEDDKSKGPKGQRGLAGQSAQIRRLTGGEETFAVIDDKTGEVVARFEERKDAKAEAKKRGKSFSIEKAGQPIVGVIENLAKNFTHLMDAAMKNHAAQLAIDEALAGGWAEKVPMAQTQALVPRAAMARALGLDPKNQDGIEAVAAIESPVHPGKDVVAIRREGKPEYYRVEDKFVLNALAGLHRAGMSWWTKQLAKLKTIFTRSITAMPGFMVRNFVRDSQGAWMQTEERGFNALEEMGKSIKALATRLDDPKVRAIMAAGGDTGWYKNAPEDVVEQLRRLEADGKATVMSLANPAKMFRTWERLGRASELANRIVAFDETLKATGSKRQAAFEAMDVLDFQLRGGSEWLQVFFNTVPFLNARVQGLYKLGRAGLSKRARKTFLAKAGIVATFSLALALINADDEDYNDLPEWRKDLFWNIPVHRFYGKDVAEETGLPMFLMIPKPFELGFLFGTVPELAVRGMTKTASGKEIYDALLRTLTDTFAMNPAGNPLFKEAIEQWANKDFFTGEPIVNQTLQYLPPEQQYDSRTSELAKKVGEVTGLSPARIQHLVRGFTGDMGTYFVSVADGVAEALGIDPPAPAKRLDERDIFRSFMSQSNPRTTKWVEQFYDIRDEAEAVARGVSARNKQGDRAGAREMQRENSGLLAARKGLDAAADSISGINKRIRDIRADEDMKPEAKRIEIERLTARKNRIAKQAAQTAERRKERDED